MSKLVDDSCGICGGKDSHHVCYQCYSSDIERIGKLEKKVEQLGKRIDHLWQIINKIHSLGSP